MFPHSSWEEGGIEALLYDDGVDDGSVASGRASSQLRINDILDALQAKYDGLRKKLMMEMLSNSKWKRKLVFGPHLNLVMLDLFQET